MKYDLHIHTNYSDGIYSPEEVVDLARTVNLSGIAITDHDTTSGVEIAIKYSKTLNDLTIIPGIELSCVYRNEEVHILGYYIDYKNPDLLNITNKLINSRIERGVKTVNKINELGLKLDIKDVKKFTTTEFIGRPHIARALILKGYVTSIEEAFEKYLKFGAPAYVERYKISITETINLIKNAGGIPVLAHPGLIKNKEILNYCVEKGIKGIEVIHSEHCKKDVLYLIEFAKINNLVRTGGSDFHGDRDHNELLLGKYYVGQNTILQLEEMI
ncbi:MAG TPA: PHP domain-containing protein [Tissierellaceae bacterium]|nr:PHP domain-containing protein [Tissierellaceae bacterium]